MCAASPLAVRAASEAARVGGWDQVALHCGVTLWHYTVALYCGITLMLALWLCVQHQKLPEWENGTKRLYAVASHNGITLMLTFWLCVQHKKLPEWVDGTEWRYTVASEDSSNMEIDVSTSVKNGIMYLEDPVDHVSVLLSCLCLC